MPLTSEPLTLSREQARRFLVRRHLLAPPRSLPADPASVLDVIARLGLLQFDPIDVPGARSHDIVLHSRIAGYRRGWCEQWLYGEDRRLIELYNKSLNILPIEELPWYRISWDRYAARMESGILQTQADVATAILARIEAEGALSTAAFADHAHVVDWWWAPTRVSRAVMEALFVSGRLGIARRDGNRRLYDLIARLVSQPLLASRVSEDAAQRHRLISHFRAAGLASPVEGSLREAIYRLGTAAERTRATQALVDEGVLAAITVEGLRGVRYVLSSETDLLDDDAPVASSLAFIAPLDPLVWDRRLLRDLWDFDYLWEIYVPESKRRWGYYVLPMLYGDSFAGRIEPRFERTTRTLRIVSIAFDESHGAIEDPRFVSALADAVDAYRVFVGAGRIIWPRTRSGRQAAAAMRQRG